MKKTGLLNAPLSHVISLMGHTDGLVVCDAGLPVPPGPARVDLAVSPGVPSFLQVLEAVGHELRIERALIAEEFPERNAALYRRFEQVIARIEAEQGAPVTVERVPHEEFKRRTLPTRGVVRTGECSPYANVILYSGVIF